MILTCQTIPKEKITQQSAASNSHKGNLSAYRLVVADIPPRSFIVQYSARELGTLKSEVVIAKVHSTSARCFIEIKTQSQKPREEIGERSIKNRGKELARGNRWDRKEVRAGSPDRYIGRKGRNNG